MTIKYSNTFSPSSRHFTIKIKNYDCSLLWQSNNTPRLWEEGMREFELFDGLCSIIIWRVPPLHLAVVFSMLFNALSSWALGQSVNRTSSFMLAGIVTSKLVKSTLLVFHATLSAQLQAFNWEKLVRLIQTLRRHVWQSSKIITTAHTLSIQTQGGTLVSANVSSLHKKTPQENAPRANVWLVPWGCDIMKS